jgi:chromosome segregation ATPase
MRLQSGIQQGEWRTAAYGHEKVFEDKFMNFDTIMENFELVAIIIIGLYSWRKGDPAQLKMMLRSITKSMENIRQQEESILEHEQIVREQVKNLEARTTALNERVKFWIDKYSAMSEQIEEKNTKILALEEELAQCKDELVDCKGEIVALRRYISLLEHAINKIVDNDLVMEIKKLSEKSSVQIDDLLKEIRR